MRPLTGRTRSAGKRAGAATVMVAACVAASCFAPPVLAETLVVGPTGDYASIAPAVAAAADGDTVLVQAGTYTGESNRGIEFGGRNLILRSVDGAPSTVIDCGGEDRAFRIHSGERQDATIRGFTVRNGHAPFGGGAYFIYASPTIEDCVFEDCSAEFSGGCIRASQGAPVVAGCTFSRGSAAGAGGGISIHEASAALSGCTVTDCSATDGGGFSCVGPCSLVLTDCTLSGNSADRGAGIYLTGCDPTLSGCIIRDNVAALDGGGINAAVPELVMNTCELSGNRAELNGGGVYITGGTGPTFAGCLFSDNVAVVRGGAAYVNQTATCSMLDCLFSGNVSMSGNATPIGGGGALFIQTVPSGSLESCSFTGNVSGFHGGAIDMSRGGNLDEVVGCVFSENQGTLGGAVSTGYGETSFIDCVFLSNEGTSGGAIYSRPESVTNCTFVANHSVLGGALTLLRSAEADVSRCTFVGNYADEGGSIWLDESAGAIHDCIIAFGAGGGAIGDDGTQWDPSSSTQVTRCVVHDNSGGDDLCCDVYDNVVADPRFCGFSVWDFTLCANSPCLPANNAWSVQVGAHGEGCGDCDSPVEMTSWGAIKALYR